MSGPCLVSNLVSNKERGKQVFESRLKKTEARQEKLNAPEGLLWKIRTRYR
jgi:hypothetical protein